MRSEIKYGQILDSAGGTVRTWGGFYEKIEVKKIRGLE